MQWVWNILKLQREIRAASAHSLAYSQESQAGSAAGVQAEKDHTLSPFHGQGMDTVLPEHRVSAANNHTSTPVTITPTHALLPPTQAWHYRGQTEHGSPCSCSTALHLWHLPQKEGEHFNTLWKRLLLKFGQEKHTQNDFHISFLKFRNWPYLE